MTSQLARVMCAALALVVVCLAVLAGAQAPPAAAPGAPGAAAGTPAAPTAPTSHGGRPNVVFSYYYWQTTGIKHWETPGNQISHLVFSFANMLKDGTITLQGPTHSEVGRAAYGQYTEKVFGYMDNKRCNCVGACLKGELYQMFLLKDKYPHLKLIMSVGGWTWSDNFSDVFASQAARQKAVVTGTELLDKFGFDGIDFDWEFPGANDKKGNPDFPHWTSRPNEDHDNAATFYRELKQYWASKSKPYEVTAALAGYAFGGTPAGWRGIAQALDYALVMAYEYQHAKPDERTRGGGTLRPADDDLPVEKANTVMGGIKGYLDLGFAKEKLVVGIPLYGNGWMGLTDRMQSRDGIPGFGIPVGANKVQMTEPTAYNILMNMFRKDAKWKSYVDTKRGINIFNNGTASWFIDSPATVAEKAKWVIDQGLGGIMLWNSNQDLPAPEDSLINAINKVYPVPLNPPYKRTSKWCIPDSEYCNLRCDYIQPAGIATVPPATATGVVDPVKAGTGGLTDVNTSASGLGKSPAPRSAAASFGVAVVAAIAAILLAA
ncbi:hypothetical protein H9P43_009164 [Blastocladiella emersonii ATCC 22665]|nr:hypothetical protein H9P43_009164 [Blastocladiella emersonii ATCC 22665]